ncbi:hypothetical protein NA56DRAFT_461089 [Hyaloscypha hepaticicola]|uniref:Secreted protein n=1 Tax=Hyaloscypha hepaticicola TaxID=2082293 RepID=A0A2J6QF56_9HELO|nr:hypothetical protein NA56DRAFT_461089 [Hyaloscypha hepaticicola]
MFFLMPQLCRFFCFSISIGSASNTKTQRRVIRSTAARGAFAYGFLPTSHLNICLPYHKMFNSLQKPRQSLTNCKDMWFHLIFIKVLLLKSSDKR